MIKKLIAKATLEPNEKLVAVISWRPWIGPYGLEWPVMRVDCAHGVRRTAVPVWSWITVKRLFGYAH